MSSAGSFTNDDYTYLINCDELIKTCQEALQENEYSSLEPSDSLIEDRDAIIRRKNGRKELSVASPADSLAEFLAWLNHMEKRLDGACYCRESSEISRKEIVDFHKSVQSQIEGIGKDLITTLRNALELTSNGKVLAAEVAEAEQRWHVLWLRSLEYVMIMEHSATQCPRHFSGETSSAHIANNGVQMETDVPNKCEQLTSSAHMSSASSYLALISRELLDEMKLRELAVNMSTGKANEDKTTDYSSICGTWPSSARRSNKIKNKRIQTYCQKISSHVGEGSKIFDLIHKDVGYSSDADLSDAIEQPSRNIGSTSTSCNNSPRRHEVRRKRARKLHAMSDKRPWSFHQGDWQDWDYTDCSTSFPASPPPYTQSASPISDYSSFTSHNNDDDSDRVASRNSDKVTLSSEEKVDDLDDMKMKEPFNTTIATQTIDSDVEEEVEVDDERDVENICSTSAIMISISCLPFIILLLSLIISKSPVLELVYQNPPPI